jgi:hypothetical protein
MIPNGRQLDTESAGEFDRFVFFAHPHLSVPAVSGSLGIAVPVSSSGAVGIHSYFIFVPLLPTMYWAALLIIVYWRAALLTRVKAAARNFDKL